MKAKLNLTIDGTVLADVKRYAVQKNVSLSALVEDHFKSISLPVKHTNILELVDRLEKPAISEDIDLKKGYYEDQAGKYGF
jgi:hypothetical protein